MINETILSVNNIDYSTHGFEILKKVSIKVNQGDFVGIIGPNGSGKSTLLKNLYKVLTPTAGYINVNDTNLAHMTNKQMAQEIAVVAQESSANFDFTVEEVVSMGRYPRKKMTEPLNQEDKQCVANVLRQVDMTNFANNSFLNLSGGEKQKVLIARALVQDTNLVVLDEPTNHLDIGSQLAMLKTMKTSGKTIIAALHDLCVALKYCNRVYVMHEGKILCEGNPHEIICSALIERLYGIKAEVFSHKGKTFIDYQ